MEMIEVDVLLLLITTIVPRFVFVWLFFYDWSEN